MISFSSQNSLLFQHDNTTVSGSHELAQESSEMYPSFPSQLGAVRELGSLTHSGVSHFPTGTFLAVEAALGIGIL